MTSFDINNSKSDDSDIAEDNEENGNPEIETFYKKPYYLQTEEAISLKKNYVLHMAATQRTPDVRIAVSLSDSTCSVYDVEQHFKNVATLPKADDVVVNLRFAPDSDNLLYTGSADCTIKVWDLRQDGKCVNEFKDTSGKTLSTFDVSCNGRFICGGTEVLEGDAFLLFWDTRTSKLLGGYWDCHTDDVTQVCFHPYQADTMATGSTDGLINIFDVSLKTEDDALLYTLNTESSVDKLSWHKNKTDSILSCITHTNDLQLWQQDGSSPDRIFSRSEISSVLKIKEENLYIASVCQLQETEDLMVLAGSNAGKGECLRSGSITTQKMSPLSIYTGNKQIVRCSWYNNNNDSLITGGECGLLSLWVPQQPQEVASKFKMNKTQKKPHKSKPY